jgi:hypothetical protein
MKKMITTKIEKEDFYQMVHMITIPLEYCCQTDGNWYYSIELPVSQPFYLLTSSSTDTPKCQMVKWAFSYLEYIVFDTEDDNNYDNQGGEHLFLDGDKKYYCYYEGTLI